MKLSSKEDVDAPITEVFEAISDFASFERSAIRRGIEVQRLGDQTTPELGLTWDVRVNFRGKARRMQLQLSDYDPVTLIGLSGESDGLKGDSQIELLALSPRRTRIAVSVDVKPKTLSGRLILQSFKLARSKIDKRFKLRVAEFAKLTEDRLKSSA
ncbi:hypothetical protein PH5382_02068 [Phaeobacter sp. CECT 5382]|uniref:SRPBCC family protein n=1 Tax=Rhodobacterales TaxID=204455 RepID=UPI0006DB282D|nr:SRPBCC family protein [Phaeobacter sp. CECT 5382]CUH88136.1 hypothetical protein PH5382_02068 [Phaeobacter sp. CECT 5382]